MLLHSTEIYAFRARCFPPKIDMDFLMSPHNFGGEVRLCNAVDDLSLKRQLKAPLHRYE